MQSHANNEVFQRAVKILETYFGEEENDDEEAPAVIPELIRRLGEDTIQPGQPDAGAPGFGASFRFGGFDAGAAAGGAQPAAGTLLSPSLLGSKASAAPGKPLPRGGPSPNFSMGDGPGTAVTVTLHQGSEGQPHGLTFADGEAPLRITAIAEGSRATKGFGAKPQFGQVLVSLQDGGFGATRQDMTGLGEAEVRALIAQSGRPLLLTFKPPDAAAGVVEVLARAGCDMAARSDGETGQQIAEREGHTSEISIDQLTEARTATDEASEVDSRVVKAAHLLTVAAATGNVELLILCLDYGVDPNALSLTKTEDGTEFMATPLCLAAGNGQLATATILLEHGASPHKPDSYGCTPLMFAAADGQAPLLLLLLEHVTDLNTVQLEPRGWTVRYLLSASLMVIPRGRWRAC